MIIPKWFNCETQIDENVPQFMGGGIFAIHFLLGNCLLTGHNQSLIGSTGLESPGHFCNFSPALPSALNVLNLRATPYDYSVEANSLLIVMAADRR